MTIDIDAARHFIESDARVLERHRMAVLLDDGPADPVLTALSAYRNTDGGFGHALEPDVRGPGSQTSAALQALEVLGEVGAARHPMVPGLCDWISSISHPDGGVPTVLPSADGHPRAPWMEPRPEAGFLTYALAARLWELGVTHPWLDKATQWCWQHIDSVDDPQGYTVLFALMFLDAVPDPARAAEGVERFRGSIRTDGTVSVPEGVEDEKIAVLDMSPSPGAPSRTLFTDEQVSAALDRLESEQLDDGGWDFHFLHFSAGQTVAWRGMVTLNAIRILRDHGRT